MDIFQVIRDRRSIRKYKDDPVEQDKIEQILDAARLAPSWKNLQCWRFLVLRDQSKREPLLDAFPDGNPGKKAIAMAPVIILVCADPAESDVENGIAYYIADTASAFEISALPPMPWDLVPAGWLGMMKQRLSKSSRFLNKSGLLV